MKLYKRGFLFIITCLGILSFLQADPTITTNGSIEITGTALSNGNSFFRTKTQIGLEFNFTDSVKGVVRGAVENTDENSSTELRESYLVVNAKDKFLKPLTPVKNSTISADIHLSDKTLEKIVNTSSKSLFPMGSKLIHQTNSPAKTNQPQPAEKITRLRSIENNTDSELSSQALAAVV